MKKYIFIIAAFAGMLLSSCSESFLDVSSKTESSTGTFYKTENDAYRALVGCYDGWRQTTSSQGFALYLAATVMSDETFGATGNNDGRGFQVVDRFDISQSSSDLNLFETEWGNYYAAIYRCNSLLNYEEQIEWAETGSKRGLYMGECHAIRALLYFEMVRFWGNIPLVTVPENANIPESDAKEVYDLVISDLKYAIANIPADAYPKANAASNDGHFTKYAAEALLARVYLYYTGIYGTEPSGLTKSEVLAGLEDVISSGEFSLIPEYKNLWPAASIKFAAEGYEMDEAQTTYAGDGNAETVLAMKFTSTQDYNGNNDGNRWLVMMGMRNLSNSPYGQGWGACTVNPAFLSAYKTGDTRRGASVIDMEAEGITSNEKWQDSVSDWREYTGYTVKKYTPLAFADGTSAAKMDGTGDFQISQHQDFVVIRYADVLLMAAELGSSNAQDYFDQVRKRAFGDAFTQVPVSQSAIMDERKAEFAFEGIRYWDLLRQGIDVAAQTIAVSNVSVLSGGTDDSITILAENIKAKNGLAQKPYNQISLSNGTLSQNAGW